MTEKIAGYENLPFAPLAEGSSVDIAVLWSNSETGPAGATVRFPEGYQQPWHNHTTSYHSVLIKAELLARTKGAAVTISEIYGPGS